MASNSYHFTRPVLRLALLIIFILDSTVAQTGICYTMLGNNLPPPSDVVALCKQNNIQRMRIYYPHKPTLQALSGSNIEVMLGVPNPDLQDLAASQANADAWVQNNVREYPNVRFRYVAVGNEVDPGGDTSGFVLPALQNVYNAISAAGLGNQIRVSTPVSTEVLGRSYPPADGEFSADVTSYLNPIIQFLVATRAPLFANLYPYFSYINNKPQVALQYALLGPTKGIVMPDGTRYGNLFFAMLDAMYAALERSGGTSLEIVASESGWPSAGEDAAANATNARIYNTNLIQLVKYGTPKRPARPTELYIYAMFDENQKPGPEDERHFGIFRPNGQPKYPIKFERVKPSMTCVFIE